MSSSPQRSGNAAAPDGPGGAAPVLGAPTSVGRRRFLQGALGVGAVAATGGIAWRATVGAPKAEGRLVLSPAELAVVTAIADTFFPAGRYAVAARDTDVAAYVDRRVSEIPPRKQRLLRAMLHTFEWGPLFVIGKWSRFSQLSLEDREAVMERYEHGRFQWQRTSHRMLLYSCSSGYFEDERVLASMGWSLGCAPTPRQPGEVL